MIFMTVLFFSQQKLTTGSKKQEATVPYLIYQVFKLKAKNKQKNVINFHRNYIAKLNCRVVFPTKCHKIITKVIIPANYQGNLSKHEVITSNVCRRVPIGLIYI